MKLERIKELAGMPLNEMDDEQDGRYRFTVVVDIANASKFDDQRIYDEISKSIRKAINDNKMFDIKKVITHGYK